MNWAKALKEPSTWYFECEDIPGKIILNTPKLLITKIIKAEKLKSIKKLL